MSASSLPPQIPGDPSLPSTPEEIASLIALGEEDSKYLVEDFFRNPEKTAFQISPGGQYVAWLGLYERRQNIFVQEIGSGTEAIRVTSETERDISGYLWGSGTRLVYIKDSGGDENYRLFAADFDGGNPSDLTPYEGVRIDIIDELKDNQDEIIIGMNANNPELFDPYLLNIHTGEAKQLASNDNPAEPITAWMTDHEGALRIAVKLRDGINTVLMYRDSEEDAFREVLTTDFRVTVQPLFFDFDNGSTVFVTSNLGRDKAVVVRFDMARGEEIGEIIFEHPKVDVSNLSWSRKRKVLTSVLYSFEKRHRHYLDSQTRELYERLEQQLGDDEVFVVSTNTDEDKFIVRTFSDRTLGKYYYYDRTTDALTELADISPWLHSEDMADMQPISYQSRDGLTIYGYLTLPPGRDPQQLPVVINPHGGPWARDSWGFNPEAQLLASRGYAVLQMNFRGSTGFGRAFWEASFGQWGRCMQDDITDGVQWLIARGIADPARIAIYGGSYGGYATLAGVTFTPDLYACAIDYVGVSNLFTFMTTIPPYWKPLLEMMYTMVGHPEKDREAMQSVSPVFYTDRITAPLFVAQGANDPRVNIDESDQIVRSLREGGVDVPYLVKYNEGHGFRNEENRFEFYKAMLGFLRGKMGCS